MKTSLLKNASSSIIQFFFNTVVLFIFYRFLLKTIGAADFGIWSLVLGVSSLTQIAAFGFSGGALKYVAKYLASQEEEKVSDIIQTSLLSVAFFVGVFILLCYPLFKIFFMNAVGEANAFKVQAILPIALICLWLTVVVGVILSSLDGYQKMYLRNYMIMASSALNLLLAFIIVPHFHLQGLAYLSLFQSLFLLITGWFFLKYLNHFLPFFPMRWDKHIFREVIGYNTQFQLISFSNMFCEPTTKYFLSKFGGVASVGYYEMASRLAGQVRGVIVSANQAVVPVIANYADKSKEQLHKIYVSSFQLLCFITLPAYLLLILSIPLINRVWIGDLVPIFMQALFVLFFSHMVNIFSNPAYFSNMGTGWLSDNLFFHIGVALGNLFLSYILGKIFGGKGVLAAWGLSLVVGSIYIFWSYNRRQRISVKEILTADLMKLMSTLITTFCLACALLYFCRLWHPFWVYIFVVALVAGIFCYYELRHPFFGKIRNWIFRA